MVNIFKKPGFMNSAAFKKQLDEFLALCDSRGLRVMFCLFDDCGEVTNPEFG